MRGPDGVEIWTVADRATREKSGRPRPEAMRPPARRPHRETLTRGSLVQKITPFLWLDGKAVEAMNFYIGIFKNARVTSVMRYGEAGPGPRGSVMSVTFELEGQEFIALNGGPIFAFSPAISFFIRCETQEEVDEFWARLSEGGQTQQCGWLKDRFGVSWQIVPTVLHAMLRDRDGEKSKRVMQAMLKMTKLDIALLTQAYERG